MARRATIVLTFNYNDQWSGGNYYILNLISSLNLLPDAVQPNILLLSHAEESYQFVLQSSHYKRLKWIRTLLKRRPAFGVKAKSREFIKAVARAAKGSNKYDFVFPFPFDPDDRIKNVFWIPDFQEKVHPQFFSQEEIEQRHQSHLKNIESFDHIVFSSRTVLEEFRRFFPTATNKAYVLNFAVSNPSDEIDINSTLKKYSIASQFFYCPNQFWIHKNHKALIEATSIIRKSGRALTVVFSGKEADYRAPGHVESLKNLAADLGVANEVKFLGFLPKSDQQALLRAASAIVQPSFSEGWSTVIEDAKAVSQFVIASDLSVHREQLLENALFFNPSNSEELAERMSDVLGKPPVRTTIDYNEHRRLFAQTFMDIVHSVRGDAAGAGE